MKPHYALRLMFAFSGIKALIRLELLIGKRFIAILKGF